MRPPSTAHIGQPAADGIQGLESDRDLQPAGGKQHGRHGAEEGEEIHQEVAGGCGQLRPVDGHDGADVASTHGLWKADDALHGEEAGAVRTRVHVLMDLAVRDPIRRQDEGGIPERS